MKSIVKFEKHSNPQKHIISEIFEKHIDFFFGKSEKHSDLLCSRTLWAVAVVGDNRYHEVGHGIGYQWLVTT